MADHQETFDQIDSKELFESATSDPVAAQAEPEVVAEQPRSPDGKFAAKAEAEPVKETPEVQAEPGKDEANVPSWRLREISEERRQAISRAENAERQAAEFRQRLAAIERQNAPKPEPVDIFANPNAWAKEQLSPFEQRMQTMQTSLTLRASRAENIAIHGKDAVTAAEQAIDEAVKSNDPDIPALTVKLKATDDPVGVAIDWHKSRSLLKETNGDLNAYKAKALEDALNDPAFLAKAMERAKTQGTSAPTSTIKLPPSLNRIASAAPASESPNDGSDEALFRYATG